MNPDFPTRIDAATVAALRAEVPAVADRAVEAIITEVPSYENALSGPMGATIRQAVQLALGGFVSLVSGRSADPRTPTNASVRGAYDLGRGEARSGRSMEALLAAYRIGARVAWRELSRTAVEAGLEAATLADFAELVFAFIDELSASSASGHSDELAASGRVRRRLLERLAAQLVDGAPSDAVRTTAERAAWEPPETLTAVLVPQEELGGLLGTLDPASLQHTEELADAEEHALLLVPDVAGTRRAALVEAAGPRRALVGPPRPWLEARRSVERVLRARRLGLRGPVDTEAHLARLVVEADHEARADLRARALAPLDGLRASTREKLEETLRAWLLHQGRREDVAAALFVHPQTVRYRMDRVRECFGERLEDPDVVRDLVIALA